MFDRMHTVIALTTLGVLASVLPAPLSAQSPQPMAQETGQALLSEMAGVDLVTLRTDQLLAQRKEDAENILRSLDQRSSDVAAMRQELDTAIEIKKRETDITKAEKDLANKQKRQADKEELERKQKRQEQERKLLERQKEAADKKSTFYDAQRTLMRAQITSFGREADLNSRIDEMEKLKSDPSAHSELQGLRTQISDLERTTLAAMEKVADAEGNASDRRRDFIRAQLEVIKARTALAALGG